MQKGLFKDDFFSELVKLKKNDEKDNSLVVKQKKVKLDTDEKTRLNNVVSTFFTDKKVVEWYDKAFFISERINLIKRDLFSASIERIRNIIKRNEKLDEEDDKKNAFSIFALRKKIINFLRMTNYAIGIKNFLTNWKYYYFEVENFSVAKVENFIELIDNFVDIGQEYVLNSIENLVDFYIEGLGGLAAIIGNAFMQAAEAYLERKVTRLEDWRRRVSSYQINKKYRSKIKSVKKKNHYSKLRKKQAIKALKRSRKLASLKIKTKYFLFDAALFLYNTNEAKKNAIRVLNEKRREIKALEKDVDNYFNDFSLSFSKDINIALLKNLDNLTSSNLLTTETLEPIFSFSFQKQDFDKVMELVPDNLKSVFSYITKEDKSITHSEYKINKLDKFDYHFNKALETYGEYNIKRLESLIGDTPSFIAFILESFNKKDFQETEIYKSLVYNLSTSETIKKFENYFTKYDDETIYKENDELDYIFYGYFRFLSRFLYKERREVVGNKIYVEKEYYPSSKDFYNMTDPVISAFTEKLTLEGEIKVLWQSILSNLK